MWPIFKNFQTQIKITLQNIFVMNDYTNYFINNPMF